MLEQWSRLPENAASYDAPPDPFSDDWEDEYIKKVYDGDVAKAALDPRYHELTGGYLYDGAKRGFKGGVPDFTPESEEWKTIKDLRKNIFQFSAAKQYQQVVIMSDIIYEQGLKIPFSEYKKTAKGVFKTFNENYLKAEFTTAVGQAQSARDWLYFEEHAEQFPWLRYHTQQDTQVRDEHRPLDGLSAKVGDPVWRSYAPKNGWRCRCFLTAHEHGRKTKRELPEFGTSALPKVFDMNPGIDRLVFDPKTHPYFFVEKGDAGLKKKDFNMVIP